MKKVLKVFAVVTAIGAAIGGAVYFWKKKSLEDEIDEFDDFDDFDDDDLDDGFEDDSAERVYTPINMDTEEPEKEVAEKATEEDKTEE